MDSPPECVLSLSHELPQSPPALPSLDYSPQASSPQTQPSLPDSPAILPINSPEPSPQSPSTTPLFPLSPYALDPDENHQDSNENDEDGESLDGVPPSPTPAVALFPGGGVQEAGCSPCLDSSPPITASAPLLGFGALELALSSGQCGNGEDELDLQLFQKDTVTTKPIPGVVGSASGPALRFPCHVCGKRFRFQSILSLHARAHTLDRRASALYRTGFPVAPLKQPLKVQPNHKDPIHRSHSNQRLLPKSLITFTEDDSDIKELEDGLQVESNPHFLLDESTPLTPPLTEDPMASPYSSNQIGEAVSTPIAPTFRCHACKGKFRTASELARHVRILHNPYKCTLCPFSASQEEILASHLQECHPAPDAPPTFMSRPIIANPETPVPTPSHTPAPATQVASGGAAGASPTVPAFRCETCGQRFTQSWFLKGHMRKHKDSLDHKCQVCGRGFKEPWFLKNHMKVHLNKLGLKAGLSGSLGTAPIAEQQTKGTQSNHSLNALYSSLLLAQRGGSGGGRGQGRKERESRLGMGSSKSAILGYLGLPSDGTGGSCMERLQAVAQVAEMGNGGSISGPGGGGGEQRKAGANSESPGAISEASEQATWWQLVARSIAVAQQQQQQQQQQQTRPQQRGQRGPGRSSGISEADQVRAYLGGLSQRDDTGGSGGSWECPDCGKLFRSLQQVVVHARVHAQRVQQKGVEEERSAGRQTGLGRGEPRQDSQLHSVGGGSGSSSSSHQTEVRHDSKQHVGGSQQASIATGFHSVISNFKGENGLPVVSSMPSLPTRERVRGRGIKDCPYCGKAFRSSHHLKVHLRVHTGERPYKCPHCDYAGTQSGSLKYHLQRHHREQRNALAASANSSSSGLTSSLNSLASGTSVLGKQRRSQPSHGPVNCGPADAPTSRSGQQSFGLLGPPDQHEHRKALSALRDVDLETQYRYLSGMMGALYQGGVEGGWIRESPPPKAQKVSRRKPLTTSRMVQPSKDGPSTHHGGFEPLDLSRRTSPGLGGFEEDGVVNFGEAESDPTGVKLSQCLFCPFRTSSAELMAMHLQVNHTSKSRRKRCSTTALDKDGNVRAPKMNATNADSLGIWKDIRASDHQVPLEEWSSTQFKTHNGLPADLDNQDRDLGSENVGHDHKDIEEDDQEEDLTENMEDSSLENSPEPDQDTGMSVSLSPAQMSNHMTEEDEDETLTD